MASLCLGVCASGAYAADVSVWGSLGQILEASDNYFLQNTPLGTTFKSLSTVNLNVLARTPGWRYLLSSNVSYYNYFGDGADAANPTSGTPINETFRVDHATDFARYFAAATYTRADVAATQLRESGITTEKGTINSFRAVGGGTHDLNRIDSLSWSVQANRTTFDNDPGQTPFTDLGATIAWTRLLDPRTSWTNSVNFDWLDADDIGKSQRLFWQIMTGVKSQLTRRLTVTASVGAAFANAYQTAPAPVFTTSTFIQSGAASSCGRDGHPELSAPQKHECDTVSRTSDCPDKLRPASENDNGRVYAQPRYQSLVKYRGIGERRAHRVGRKLPDNRPRRLFLGADRLHVSVGARLARAPFLYVPAAPRRHRYGNGKCRACVLGL